jgi:hypothetical protein
MKDGAKQHRAAPPGRGDDSRAFNRQGVDDGRKILGVTAERIWRAGNAGIGRMEPPAVGESTVVLPERVDLAGEICP